MLHHCAKRSSNLDPGVARVRNAHGANAIAWPYRQAALLLLLSGSNRTLRHRPRWRLGAEEAASLNAPTRGIPPDRAKTKAAGVGPGCCEGPPGEVSILCAVGLQL